MVVNNILLQTFITKQKYCHSCEANKIISRYARKSINTCDAIKQRYIQNIWSTVKIAGSSGGS